MAAVVGTFSGSASNGGSHTESLAFTPDIVFLGSTWESGEEDASVGVIAGSYNHYCTTVPLDGKQIWGSGKVAYNTSTKYMTGSIGTDDFTVTDGGASAYIEQADARVAYLALGGLDEVDGRLVSTSTSVDVNLGWEPDLVILMSALPTTVNTLSSVNRSSFNIALCDGTGSNYVVMYGYSNNAHDGPGYASDVSAVGNTGVATNYSNTQTFWEVTFSGTGYTISHSSGATRHVTAIALKGIEWEGFVDASIPQTTQTDTHGAGLSDTPEGTLLVAMADGGVTDGASWSFGFSDGTNDAGIVHWDDLGQSIRSSTDAALLGDADGHSMRATVSYSGSNETEVNWIETSTYAFSSSDLWGLTFRTTGAAAASSTVGFGHIPIGI